MTSGKVIFEDNPYTIMFKQRKKPFQIEIDEDRGTEIEFILSERKQCK